MPQSIYLQGHDIYGSSRIGLLNHDLDLTTISLSDTITRQLGAKQYEFANHLGNVLTTVSDQTIPVASGSVIVSFNAKVTSTSDYGVWGDPLVGNRSYSSSNYKYGFSGKEKLDELHGNTGDAYDFGARLYDARLGRWTAVDPMAKKYPEESPFAYSLDNPIYFIDPSGGEVESSDKTGTVTPNFLVGTAVHVAAAVYFNTKPGYQAEVSFSNYNVPFLKPGRADLVYRDANGNIAIWEIKPVSYRGAVKKVEATAQLNRYVALAAAENPGSLVSTGSSGGAPVPFEGTLKLTATEGLYTYDVNLFIPKGEEGNGLIYYTLENPRLTEEAEKVVETAKTTAKVAAVAAVVTAGVAASTVTGGGSAVAAAAVVGVILATPADENKSEVEMPIQQ